MDIFVFRGPNGYLIPADERSKRYVDRHVPADGGLKLSAKVVRQLWKHRKFFALLRIIAENSDTYRNEEAALVAVKLAAGHCDWQTNPLTGELIPVPKSIAFANMDQAEFSEFYERALDGTIHMLLPAMNRIALEEAIDRVLHFA